MSKRAIICVDDEKSVLISIKAQLKNNFGNQYTYEMVDNAHEALDVIDYLVGEGVNVILIVSDFLMPEMKGDEFLIQVHKKYPKVVTMLLTGQADQSAIDRAYQDAGLFACLAKPWDANELIQIINAATKNI